MLDINEARALLRLVQSERKNTRQSLQLACLYAAQALLACAILIVGYHLTNAKAVTWALVSAILVLQPGIQQSLAASAVRIAANLVGGLIGLATGELLGLGHPQLLLAILLTIFACELLRLDLGLRTACVATIIVMTAFEGRVVSSSFDRLAAVLIGCTVAVLVQLLMELVRRQFGWTDPLFSLSSLIKPSSPRNEGE